MTSLIEVYRFRTVSNDSAYRLTAEFKMWVGVEASSRRTNSGAFDVSEVSGKSMHYQVSTSGSFASMRIAIQFCTSDSIHATECVVSFTRIGKTPIGLELKNRVLRKSCG